MLAACLNHRQLIHYERFMESIGFIRMTDDGMWVATAEGKRFVQLYEEVLLSLRPVALQPAGTSPLLQRV